MKIELKNDLQVFLIGGLESRNKLHKYMLQVKLTLKFDVNANAVTMSYVWKLCTTTPQSNLAQLSVSPFLYDNCVMVMVCLVVQIDIYLY